MTAIFRPHIGQFVHVYLDDIFIFSNSIKDHEEHLGLVFATLRESQLFLSPSKANLYSERMYCLGHIIDDKGIHADMDKMRVVREWRTPRTYKDVQRFLGLVQYLAQFMPDISAYSTLLSAAARNNRKFPWTPLYEKCFQQIKLLACRSPILKLINAESDEPIWVITDGCQSGDVRGPPYFPLIVFSFSHIISPSSHFLALILWNPSPWIK